MLLFDSLLKIWNVENVHLGSDLVSALACLDVDDLTHGSSVWFLGDALLTIVARRLSQLHLPPWWLSVPGFLTNEELSRELGPIRDGHLNWIKLLRRNPGLGAWAEPEKRMESGAWVSHRPGHSPNWDLGQVTSIIDTLSLTDKYDSAQHETQSIAPCKSVHPLFILKNHQLTFSKDLVSGTM